jgi:cytochrome c biogenesis protein CcmG/thiol:disulfide interchange protein DsbE
VRRDALAGGLVLAIALAGACGGTRGDSATPASGAVDPGAPPIALTLPALDGGELSIASYRGKVVVMHVFTTWSLAAQAEVEALSAADAAEDVVVVGIALDPEGRMLVAPWRSGAGVRYLVALADPATLAGQGPLGALPAVPITIVLDRAGRIAARADRQLAPGELDAMISSAR